MSRRTDTAHRAHQDLTAALNGLGPAIQRLMDARPALPGAASTDGTRGRGGTSSVEALALNGDPTAAEIRQLDQVLRRLGADAMWLAGFVSRQTPRAPSDKDRREVERTNSAEVAECWWMRKHTDTFEPALCTSNLGGMLDQERPVCRWVYDFARSRERMPTAEECQRHASGQIVRVGA